MTELYEQDPLMIQESLEDWVITKCEDWRDNYESNYEQKFEEYYRLWRGQWSAADSERGSERSRIISPALQQAVESNVAELIKHSATAFLTMQSSKSSVSLFLRN